MAKRAKIFIYIDMSLLSKWTFSKTPALKFQSTSENGLSVTFILNEFFVLYFGSMIAQKWKNSNSFPFCPISKSYFCKTTIFKSSDKFLLNYFLRIGFFSKLLRCKIDESILHTIERKYYSATLPSVLISMFIIFREKNFRMEKAVFSIWIFSVLLFSLVTRRIANCQPLAVNIYGLAPQLGSS